MKTKRESMKNKNNKHSYKILDIDPYLAPYEADIELRMNNYYKFKTKLFGENKDNKKNKSSNGGGLSSFANGYLYFGFHKSHDKDGNDGWYYREWAPNAKSIALIGDFNGWNRKSHKLSKSDKNGDIWEIFIHGVDSLPHGSKVKINITADGKSFDRIPLYCKRVVQDPDTNEFCGQIWDADYSGYSWRNKKIGPNKIKTPLIYESHIGMCSEEEKVASFRDYINIVLPRVKKLGYNTIQLMAVMEHPYYGSFGYQVSNFFAVSSRFGTPEELKELIDTAHNMDIAVLLDLVHSHAAPNVLEGLAEFDGTDYQFFHSGAKGSHPAWAKDAKGKSPRLNDDLLDIQKNYIDKNDMFYIAIDDDNRVIGMLGTNTFSTTDTWLKRLYVKPDMKRKGIASALLLNVEEYVKAKGIVKIHTRFSDDNNEAPHFYFARGFVESDRSEGLRHLIKKIDHSTK
ncbi:4-alpha-glucan-branching enzyme [Holotrichia oblita]|nr:4-alpha-glucan-branching enzyme [Holotrichia oblita]